MCSHSFVPPEFFHGVVRDVAPNLKGPEYSGQGQGPMPSNKCVTVIFSTSYPPDTGVSLGVKGLGRVAIRSPPSSAQVRNGGNVIRMLHCDAEFSSY